MNSIKKFVRDEDGVTAIEYGLLAAAIAAVLVLITPSLSGAVKAVFNKIIVALGGTAVA